jgi:glycosyltransferase involved in cell wall biosynthesis
MRIVHVNHAMTLGGAEMMVIDLAAEQARLGHSVSICVLGGSGPLDQKTRECGLTLVHLNAPKNLPTRVRLLTEFLRADRYDVAHGHWGVWLPTAIAARLSVTHFVLTHHGNESRRNALQHRVACALTDRVVVLTPEADVYIKRWVGVPTRKLAVIPNGIHPERIQQATRIEIEGIPPDAPVVGMIARLCPPKDYVTFLRAAEIVVRRFPSAHFVAVGGGHMQAMLEEERARMGLDRFHFLGHRLDAPAILQRLTINVLATRNEGLSITLLEAACCGRASIASDIPANRFLLEDGKAGVLTPVGDAPALAAAIELLLSDEALRKGYEERSRKRSEDFSSTQMARAYLELYATLLK